MVVALQWGFVVSVELFNVSICLSVQDLYWWYLPICKNCRNPSSPESFQPSLAQPWLPWGRTSSEFLVYLSLLAKVDDKTGGGDGAREGAGREQLTVPNPLLLLIKSGSFWVFKNLGLFCIYSTPCSAWFRTRITAQTRPEQGLCTRCSQRPQQCRVREGVCSYLRLFLDNYQHSSGGKKIIMSWKGGHTPA